MTLEQLRELYRRWAPTWFVVLALFLISAAIILAEDFAVFAAVVLVMAHHVVRVSEACDDMR
jgi:hypothetical protein